MSGRRTIKCPNCSKKFADNGAVYTHIKSKHNGKGKGAFRPQHEPSMAELMIEAEQNRAAGIANEPWIGGMLP